MQELSITRFKSIRALRQRKHREAASQFLAEGRILVEEALRFGNVETILVAEDACQREDMKALVGKAKEKNISCLSVTDKQIQDICDAQTPQGIVAVVAYPKHQLQDICNGSGPVIVLENVQDPSNLGSIIRSAAAFGMAGVICLRGCVDCFNAKAARSSQGGLWKVPLAWNVDLETLNTHRQQSEWTLYATTLQDAQTLQDVSWNNQCLIAFGNEGAGVSDSLLQAADHRVCIPMHSDSDSINIGHAAAVFMSHLSTVL